MSDTNLDPSITALTNRASTVAVTATARELMNISRLAPSLEQSENTDLEIAINARAEDLAPSATATELKSIGKAIGNVLEPETFVAGGTLPNQAQNSGNFLATNGTAESWGGLSVSTLSEVNISSIMNDETLVYNHVNGLFENNSQVFRIQEIGLTENIPASGAFGGQVVFDQQTSELKYWDGSEWKVAAVVAAAGGGGASGVTWTGNITPLYTITTPSQPSGHGYSERYGRSSAMNANYIAVADSRRDEGNTDAGSVFVYSIADGSLQYTINGFAEYHQIAMQPDEGESNAQTIAMSENLLLIGWGYDRTPSQSGQRARLYDVATGTMLHEYSTTAAGGTNHSTFKDGFGCAVTINSDETKIAVGANRWRRSGDWMGRGAALIYDISDLNSLSSTPIKTIFGDDAGGGDWSEYGRDLNFSGVNTLSVLLPNPNKVFVHDVTDAGSTPRYSIETPSIGAEALDSFGEWNDSTFVLAVANSTGGNEGFGAVYVFRQADLSSTTTSYTTKIDNPYQDDRAVHGGFSNSMKILGNDHILIGMRSRQASSYDGKAFIYNLDGTQVQELTNPDTANNTKRFGHDVEADRTTGKFLVTSDQAGKAFVYQSEQTAAGGGSGEVVWSAADSTIATIGGTDIGHTLTSTQLSDGRNIVIAGFDHNSFYAYDLADNSLIWNVSSAGSVPDDNGAMASSGDYFAAIEGGSVRVRSALDGSYADGGSSLLSIPGWGSNQVQSISMHGNYIFLPRTAYNQYAMVKWDTREIVWQYTDTNHPWNIVNSNPNAGIAAYNHDMGENYLAVQDMYSHSGAYQAGAVHIIDYLTGQEVSRLDDPNPVVNGRFGGISGRENGIAVSGDKAIIGDPNDGHGKVHIFDMPTGTLEFTIDENTAGGSGIAYYDRQSTAGYNFGQEIEAYGDYAVVSHNWDSYIIQISTGEIKHETALLNIDRVTMVENYAIGGDLNTNNLRIIKGIIS